MSRRHWITLGCLGLLFAATWVAPQWPAEQALHHSLTIVAVGVLVWVQRRHTLPYASFLLIVAFLALHTVAARWLYSTVPYDDWTEALFGVRLGEALGWQRNHFDRLVHFAYGVCLAPVLWRFFVDRLHWRRGWAAVAAVDVVLSTGALYEVFEWGIALALAPDAAEAYNGQQGDMFDPQKDMVIAVLGALLAIVVTLAATRRRSGSERQEARSSAPGTSLPTAV